MTTSILDAIDDPQLFAPWFKTAHGTLGARGWRVCSAYQ